MAETENKQGYTYYYSDDRNAEHHCLPLSLPYELKELPWKMHKEKPDESLVDPVWSTAVNNGVGGWIEYSAKSMPQQIATLQLENKEIKKTLEENKKNEEEKSKQNDEMKEAMKGVQESNAQMLNMLTQMMMGGASMPTPQTATAPSTDEKKED